MLVGFTITNPSGETFDFPLADPEQTGVCATDVTGLGPPTTSFVFQTIYVNDGALFNNARSEKRNIVFMLEMVGDDIPGARRRVYRAFPIKREVTIQIETQHQVYEIKGYVESVTPTIFSKNETVQVSVLCPQPFLTVPGRWEYGTAFEDATGGFEFPFSNPRDETTLEFGTRNKTSSMFFDYHGEVVCGIRLHLPLMGQPGVVSVFNHTMDTMLQLNMDQFQASTGIAPGAGMILEIDSRPETFGARVTTPTKTINATGFVTAASVWPKLQPGMNQYEVYTSKSNAVSVFSAITLYYNPLFMGV